MSHKEPTHPIQAVSIAYWQNGRFLLVRRKNQLYHNWYAFPGGKVEAGENGRQAAHREFFEETNLLSGQMDYFVTLNFGHTEKRPDDYFLSVYCAYDVTGEEKAGDDASEILWLSLNEMKDKPVIPSVYQVAEQIVQGPLWKSP